MGGCKPCTFWVWGIWDPGGARPIYVEKHGYF